MPEPIDPQYQVYTPAGIIDSIDGNTGKPGGMASLANLIPDPETAGLFTCRAAAYALTAFPGFTAPGYVSVKKVVGSLVVGLVATSRNAGQDEPFVYNKLTGAFVTVSGVTAANTPASPATSGAWTPPTVDAVGGWIIFTSPGFSGANFYGWLDMTGFSSNSITAVAVAGSAVLGTVSTNPILAGVTPGMTVSGVNIAAGSRVVSLTGAGLTITLDKPCTGNGATTLTIAGGTAAAPLWCAGNTNVNGLPTVPVAVTIYGDRSYFSCGNVLYYTDVLNPLNMSNPTNSLTLGGNDTITATAGQPFFTTQTGGIIASLLAFKSTQIWQVTGDLATGNLVFNKLSDGVGTGCPRSIATTPLGTMFVASDGVRTVSLDGKVAPPNSDLKLPFINPVVPSRVCAAYNVGFYRICTTYLKAGVMQKLEFWLDTTRELWTGPHSLTYDSIIPVDSTFYASGPSFNGQIFQSNVIPNEQTDFFTELGVNLTWVYQHVLAPEFRPMPGWTLFETSIFMGFQLQQTISAQVLDQAYNVLGSVSFTTKFLAPANATNWKLNFTETETGGGVVKIPTRHQFKLSGTSSSNLRLGSIFAHYQYQSDNNALDIDNTLPNTLDFGLVTDPILNIVMDWGGVTDTVLATVDFENVGNLPGPP